MRVDTRLVNPIKITIQQIDKTNTFYDEDYREPIQHAARKINIVLPGQVTWERQENVRNRHLEIGDIGDSDGAIIFRVGDLARAGVVLAIGDRIIKMGHVDVDVYVTSFQYTGHWASHNGPIFQKAFFVDRRPAKQGRGLDA